MSSVPLAAEGTSCDGDPARRLETLPFVKERTLLVNLESKKPELRSSLLLVSLTYKFLFGNIGIIIIPFYKVVDVIALSLYIKMFKKLKSTIVEMY